MRAIVDPALPGPFGPYSHVVVDGGQVLTAGFGPHTADGVPADAETCAHAALDNLEAALATVGCALADVLRLTVLVDDLAVMLPAVDAALAARIPAPHPVRTVLQAAALPGGVPLALDAIARIPDPAPSEETA
jgi:enamine deaminase RidA (YjgF/YER057c/UK114 family)